MDFDPRDVDTRDRDELQIEELRWSGDPRDQDDRERDFDRDRDKIGTTTCASRS